MIIKDKIARILAGMKQGTFERDEPLALSLLSALAGESIFLLGLPGVGKSMIARRLKYAFKDATVFEYLMSRFSTPDEIFGPVSISKLKDEDCYERVTTGFLPEAEVAFLDEIWKAGPAIQNSLLTVLNEKIYLNGNQELHLPLKGIIAASNELPAQDEGLEALWDRFLIRYIVCPIEDKDNFKNLLAPAQPPRFTPIADPITDEEYKAIGREAQVVEVPDMILDCIVTLRNRLIDKMNEKEEGKDKPKEDNAKYYVSDRRWKKAVGVMKTSACLNGRDKVDYSDLLLLSHMLWNEDGMKDELSRMLAEIIIAGLFKDILEKYKSYKRHAVASKPESRLYTPDNKHYIILCDDSPMKIDIRDYNTIRNMSNEVFFGAETTDGTIILRPRGQFTIRFSKDGYLNINGYNYALRTVSDEQLSRRFIVEEVGDSLNNLVNGLFRDINRNLFTKESVGIHSMLQTVIDLYKKRIEMM